MLDRILQMYDQGVFHKTATSETKVVVDPDETFPRGETRHGALSMKNLMWLFEEALKVPVETVMNLAARVKLQGARWLWFWALDVDPKDALTAKTLKDLKPWAAARYRQMGAQQSPLQSCSFNFINDHIHILVFLHLFKVRREIEDFRIG